MVQQNLLDEVKSKNVTNSNQQIRNELLLSKQQVNQSSVNNTNGSSTTLNLDNLTQLQQLDLISSTVSTSSNIDKAKVTISINDFI